MTEQNSDQLRQAVTLSPLAGPETNPEFSRVLDELVAAAKRGQRTNCEVYNPSDQWLKEHMPILQNLPPEKQQQVFDEVKVLQAEAQAANAEGKAATKVWPEVVVELDNQGLDFFSQLGVVRRPDLTQYFIDGFGRNRDALAFDEENQALFTEVFEKIAQR